MQILIDPTSYQTAPQWIWDAGNRYTYRFYLGGDGAWRCEGGHLWSSGRPAAPGSNKLFWNPNTGETKGQWIDVSHAFFPSEAVAIEPTPKCGEAVWAALVKQVECEHWEPTQADYETFRAWCGSCSTMKVSTPGLGCLLFALGTQATKEEVDAFWADRVFPDIPKPVATGLTHTEMLHCYRADTGRYLAEKVTPSGARLHFWFGKRGGFLRPASLGEWTHADTSWSREMENKPFDVPTHRGLRCMSHSVDASRGTGDESRYGVVWCYRVNNAQHFFCAFETEQGRVCFARIRKSERKALASLIDQGIVCAGKYHGLRGVAMWGGKNVTKQQAESIGGAGWMFGTFEADED